MIVAWTSVKALEEDSKQSDSGCILKMEPTMFAVALHVT